MPAGSHQDAIAVYYQHYHDLIDGRLGYISQCGKGEDRTVYRIGNVVYKAGRRRTANPYDHRTQEEARRRGYRWAPAVSTLWAVHDGYWGTDDTVLAMPFLENDGSQAVPGLMAEMQAQASAGDVPHCSRPQCTCHAPIDSTNYVVIGGQPVVIDFCTVRLGAP